jgi:sodium/bile acid cotransporter 7
MKRFFLRLDVSLLWILAVILCAWAAPSLGSKEGVLPISLLIKIGIFWIFFSQGVNLGWRDFWSGLGEWRVHLFIQLFSFVLMPLSVLALVYYGLMRGDFFPASIGLGLLFLAILPTTISTSALMAERAGGDVATVSWNILFSNVLGIFLVPLGTAWLLQSDAGAIVPRGAMFLNLCGQLVLPMLMGMLLQRWLQDAWVRWRSLIRQINMFFIYLMVYAALCDGLVSGSWQSLGLNGSFLLGLMVLGLLVFWHGLAWLITGWMGFKENLRIAAVFTAAQKTLAAGVPMAGVVFLAFEKAGETLPPLSLFLLPLLMYHPMQLILGAVLVQKMKKSHSHA